MRLLAPDLPEGNPSFALSADQVATVLDLLCEGVEAARGDVAPGMLEVPTTVVVRKAMRRVKRARGLTNLQIRGEHEIDDMARADPSILGRIDLTLQFLHQFGDEDAYVAVECKRVAARDGGLSARYVSEGVRRFAEGRYAAGHPWGFMLGYVLALPVDDVVAAVNHRLRADYGEPAALRETLGHPRALRVVEGDVPRATGTGIRLKHVFVDMLCAAPDGRGRGGGNPSVADAAAPGGAVRTLAGDEPRRRPGWGVAAPRGRPRRREKGT